MLKAERHNYILNLLEKEGKVHAVALSEALQISVDTVRRDLQALADAGKVTRVHGGALPASPKSMDFVSRQFVSSAAKLEVAKTAVSLIQNHQVIFMDNGTTTLMLAQQLPHNLQATIVTHSLPLALAFVDYPEVDVVLVGGKLDKQERVVVGVSVVETYRRIQADACFLGICSLHPETGITVTSLEESYVKQAMIEQSSEVVALATKDKLGTVAPYRAAPIAELTHLVTETAVSITTLNPYRAAGITVLQ
ncbi:MAG: DeoR/GlpR transcriptional regulator [Chloroflexi bacterium]|nr:MAG: DeoR/GlpR transcriptional regulator [Chloroflexota bacterium]